jgi:hypothetical protein
MNWMTKAKSRIGRGGKSKSQVENQMRLTAFNKLPSRQARKHYVPSTSAHEQHNSSNSAISGDIMMLGLEPLEASFANPAVVGAGASSGRSRSKPAGQHKKQDVSKGNEDLLSLLEFTVSNSK